MKTFCIHQLALLVFLIVAAIGVNGQPLDQHFPKAGHFAASASTGIPFVAIGEVAIGVTDGFAIGLVAGTTPVIEAYGIRVRGILYEKDDHSFKVFARVPILYYPKTKDLGGEPWYLTHPVVATEWRLASNIRIQASVGFVAAQCAFSLYDKLGISKEPDEEMEGMGFEGGFWNTFGTGIAIPVSEQITVHSEVHGVFSGLKLSSEESWIGGPPVVLTMAITYNF